MVYSLLLSILIEPWELLIGIKITLLCPTPGPDGFQPIFYKKFWHVVGDSVYNMVNRAFLTGICPMELAETLVLWVKVLQDKYVRSQPLLTIKLPSNASSCWKAIHRAIPFLKDGFAWRVGDGRTISFWFDRWVGEAPLQHCLWAKSFWHQILGNTPGCFFSSSIDDWLNMHIFDPSLPSTYVLNIVTGAWVVWCARNKDVLQHEAIPTFAQRQWHKMLITDCSLAFSHPTFLRHTTNLWISWHCPPLGFVKLNVDGSALGNPGDARFGGLIRDAYGRWLIGFSGYIGHASILVAELQALRHGLTLAWDRGYRRIVVESDSQDVVTLVLTSCPHSHPMFLLVEDIRTLLARDWCCSLQHIFREANHCADFLAKQAPGLRLLLQDDQRSVAFLRC
ncbi:hypothetical protein K2173_021068 [Erythroxylum novogranatense]|uniref:RNase H type-1 domain-containing protein n=1 Tax=Erythroxylum novogranatense TaxID=1862640 RepID=A0AAV8TPK8_9ROSI|nr:hypothetical protein K2173_021068 [Erythroxylum novogranatense]